MRFLKDTARRLVTEEDGHAQPGLAALAAAIGAIVLGIGAASGSDIAAIVGGVVLGLGILGSTVLSHMTVDYDIFARLEELEKNKK